MADAHVTKPVEQEEEANESQIAVHWREEEYYYPSPKFIGQANLSDPAVNERFGEKNFPECFCEYADLLTWDTKQLSFLLASRKKILRWRSHIRTSITA